MLFLIIPCDYTFINDFLEVSTVLIKTSHDFCLFYFCYIVSYRMLPEKLRPEALFAPAIKWLFTLDKNIQ